MFKTAYGKMEHFPLVFRVVELDTKVKFCVLLQERTKKDD